MRQVTFTENSDYVYLKDMLERIKIKACNPDSRFFDDAVIIERILADLDRATLVSAQSDNHIKSSSSPRKKLSTSLPLRNGCSTHPSYQAKRMPRTDCTGCWEAYREYNPMSYSSARRKFEQKHKGD